MNILLVGGTFNTVKNPNGSYGKASGLIYKMDDAIRNSLAFKTTGDILDTYNGGDYNFLQQLLQMTPRYDIVFWFANVDNSLPKIRDVKSVAPKTMLVTSKRNSKTQHGKKYSFPELVQRALISKSNLMFEFSETDEGLFNMLVFDFLGCAWYNGTDITQAVNAALQRLYYLASITRQRTVPSPEDDKRGLMLKWFFDQFAQDVKPSDKTIDMPDEQASIDLVHGYAEQFHKLMHLECNTPHAKPEHMPPQVGRCSKGMPSFRLGDYIFISQRNVSEEYLELSHFVPIYTENGEIYYCGDKKPTVDAPVQLKLYQALPNIRYILHSHCYIQGADFTDKCIPCGAVEEADEILRIIDEKYPDRNQTFYQLNLLGHGSILMGGSVEEMKGLLYRNRPMPELWTMRYPEFIERSL